MNVSASEPGENTVKDAAEPNPQVVLETSLGTIVIELYPDKAPKTVANFLQYVNDGYYDGTIFHRVISHFMIQGGGFSPDMQKKATRSAIANEANNGLSNQRGSIAMARTMAPHSATAQFFINVQNNKPLDFRGENSPQDWGYAVFGQVIQGMDVVDEIRFVKTGSHSQHRDVPVEPVIIKSAKVKP